MIAWLLACGPVPAPRCVVEDGLPVFPGAEGFGTRTPGGRGGRTLLVTSLEDDGPGTLREAVATSGPRTIVFQVAGEIALRSQLEIMEPFLTIAGQSAPGEGVVITGAGLVVFTHDVVLQHLRIRPGLGPVDPELNDALQVLGEGAGVDDAHHVVLDHLSLSWSEDEIFSTLWAPHDLTLSNSIVAEALDRGRHPKGGHSAGLLVADGSSCVSVHHNLLAHNGFRNPLLSGGGRVDYVNNLAYDWAELAGELEPRGRPLDLNLVGNVWKAGPDTDLWTQAVVIHTDHPFHYLDAAAHLAAAGSRVRLFERDNTAPGKPLVSLGWDPVPIEPENRVHRPFVGPRLATVAAEALEEVVLAEVGARLPVRDAVDARIVDEVANGTGGLVDDPAEVGGAAIPAAAAPPEDADRDGLPDDWERAHGLDPADPDDGRHDDDGDGYTNLEAWLYGI